MSWGSVALALACVLLGARWWLRRHVQQPAQAGAQQKKALWIRRSAPAATMEGGEGTASGGGAAGDDAAAQQQQAAALSQAQRALQGTAGQGGEAQVAAAMKALEAVRSVMAAQGRSEQEVLAALHAAAADNRQVVASDTRPGPDWQPLLPQELGAEESVLAETGRDGIIGDAAVDPDSCGLARSWECKAREQTTHAAHRAPAPPRAQCTRRLRRQAAPLPCPRTPSPPLALLAPLFPVPRATPPLRRGPRGAAARAPDGVELGPGRGDADAGAAGGQRRRFRRA